MENISLSQGEATLTAKKILDNPEEMAKRARFMYWVPDNTREAGGYYKLVKTQAEVPNGLPSQECIIMG